MVYKVFLYLLLISLYVVFFGIKSFERFKEDSIVVSKRNLDIASSDMNVRPGDIRFFKTILIQSELELYVLQVWISFL